MLLDSLYELNKRLNAPFGARCFLTLLGRFDDLIAFMRLNAPFGARCFLTEARELAARAADLS